jgi:hypothetical protein
VLFAWVSWKKSMAGLQVRMNLSDCRQDDVLRGLFERAAGGLQDSRAALLETRIVRTKTMIH